MSYLDFGDIVFMWSANGFAGTSNSTSFAIGNIPVALRSRSGFRIVQVVVEDNSIPQKAGAMYIDTDDTAGFALGNVSALGGAMSFLTTGWTNAGGKGLAPGFIAMYAK
jgi:hypothetical protein